MTGLNEAQRTALERVVVQARATMEDDLAATLRGQYGISPDGIIEDEDRLADDEHLRTLRRALIEILDYLRAGGANEAEAVERLVREATFTHVNRLIAIRVADALEVLPPSLRDGPRSDGFLQVLQLAPLLATYDDTGGYWTYLQLCADELARDVPALFDPRNPMLALRPSRSTIDTIVEALADEANHDIWSADDTFGWAYQFFNTGDERKAMRDASQAPRDPRELAVRNQFFTPRYVVDFLTQNTLGRRLLDANPQSALLEELPLLIDPPVEQGSPHDLSESRVLDPACGSGHFLLGCYEILEKAWLLQGIAPRAAAPEIVKALWGVDIDPRAVQVAQAAVIFRARKACGHDPLPAPNIATARALPDDEGIWRTATAGLSTERRKLVEAMRDALREAPALGTLLRAEEHLTNEIRSTVLGADSSDENLFSSIGIADDAFGHAERDVIRALQRAADLAESSVGDRLLAANANDSIRFLEAVRHRYDAVLMNPPFGLPIAESEGYLRSHYPAGWTDLYAAFTLRGFELASDQGYVGSITSSQYFVTRKMKPFRQLILDRYRPTAIIDLGSGVLRGAGVNTSTQVFAQRSTGSTCYLDLTEYSPAEKGIELERQLADARRVSLDTFAAIDGIPFAFHTSSEQLGAWGETERFEPELAEVRSGGNTFDNFRFLRARWEVPPLEIGTDYLSFQKGGEYTPYWASSHLVLRWHRDGHEIKDFAVRKGVLPQVLQSSSYWRRAGLTYPRVNSRGALGVRILPEEEVFSGDAISIFLSPNVDPYVVLGMLNSTPVARLVSTFGRGRKLENSAVKRLPIGQAHLNAISHTRNLVIDLVAAFREFESIDETRSTFVGFRLSSSERLAMHERLSTLILDRQNRVDEAVDEVLGTESSGGAEVESRAEMMVSVVNDLLNAENWAHRTVSYLVGLVVGRWSIRPANEWKEPDLFEAANPVPPAAGPNFWPVQAGLSKEIFTEDEGGATDLVAAIVDLAVQRGMERGLDEAVSVLSRDGIRSYIRRGFFKDHVGVYSQSRRQAPLYWQLTVPSGLWSVWVYAPALSRETLFAVATEVDRRIAFGEERVRSLATEGDAGVGNRELASRLDRERTLIGQLTELRDDVSRIAATGWEPNLDDGFVLNAAPLSRWFPKNTWKQASEALTEIRQGAYEWANIHEYRGKL